MRALSALLIAASLCRADVDLAELRKGWPKFDRVKKLRTLMRLRIERSPKTLVQCESWLGKESDFVVCGHLLRVIASHISQSGTRTRAESAVSAYVRKHLAGRRRREAKEFSALHRKLRKKVPPDNVMTAGANWKDPYDVNRKLPADILAERLHMREVIAAIEGSRSPGLRPSLRAIFREHHDPAVLVRVVEAFELWQDWAALTEMADLVRIQQHGRELGGGAVIGNKRYDTLKLKWDAYKDQLWWSRPEYVPRVTRPICKAASKITGVNLRSATEIDAWLLKHGDALRKHGVVLSRAFRERARVSQR